MRPAFVLVLSGMLLAPAAAHAVPISLLTYSAFITSAEIAATDPAGSGNAALEDDRVGGSGYNEFGTANLGVSFPDIGDVLARKAHDTCNPSDPRSLQRTAPCYTFSAFNRRDGS